jgi:hypothetical protein
MTQLAVAEQTGRQVARPPKVLVPLIKEDFRQGDEAADRAALPFYRAAGEKLIEAKAQMARGEFMSWVQRNFHRSQSQANRYMQLAGTTPSIQITRRGGLTAAIGEQPRWTPATAKYPEPVKESIDRARREAERLQAENLSRAELREAQRKLALRLIDIGFKVLSKELHPDRGGSRDAMQMLNLVRDRLKASA